MHQIYFTLKEKLVCINRKNIHFFAKKFPKSYEIYLKNKNIRNKEGFYIQLKKGSEYGYAKIHFKKDNSVEKISIHEKENVE